MAEMTQSSQDPVELAKAAISSASRTQKKARMLQPKEYFPITRRQMKQSWRYLRRPVREGPKTELDINATITQLGREGMLLSPVLIASRVNQTELLLLCDRDGSMIPFQSLSQRLVETALQAGRLGSTSLYYFNNCPIDYVYEDPYFLDAEPIDDLLQHRVSKRTVVMIFSDGGAARGGFNDQRVRLTRSFLERLSQQMRYVTWLNPMPRDRWINTTAGAIAQQVPMVEVSRAGFQSAINVLRGR